jgi:hypothetical protein
MGLSRSTYYDVPSWRTDDAALVATMIAICDEFEAYGYRRVSEQIQGASRSADCKILSHANLLCGVCRARLRVRAALRPAAASAVGEQLRHRRSPSPKNQSGGGSLSASTGDQEFAARRSAPARPRIKSPITQTGNTRVHTRH